MQRAPDQSFEPTWRCMDWDRSRSLTSCLLSRFTCGIFRRSTFFELLPPEPAGCRNLHLDFEKINIFWGRRVEIARGICWGPPGLHDARYILSASLRWNRLCLNADCQNAKRHFVILAKALHRHDQLAKHHPEPWLSWHNVSWHQVFCHWGCWL